MHIEITTTPVIKVPCHTLIINVFEETIALDSLAEIINQALSGHITTYLTEQPECRKYGTTTIIPTWGAIEAKRILLLGMGKKSELSLDKIRALAAIAARTAQKSHAESVGSVICDLDHATYNLKKTIQAIVEGTMLGTYQFNYYKTEKQTSSAMTEFILITKESENNLTITEGILQGKIIGESVNQARDLVNHPASYMTSTQMAIQAKEIATKYNLEIEILEQNDMEEKNMHALLAVAKGSSQPPKMIVLKYIGNPNNKELTAFVGKGVTFDSGGISIKPSLNMGEMKGDMAGAATVLATMHAIGKLKPNVNILGIIPCTENMPSGDAYKPGDVISSMNGKSIEIITTDAEGRLLLADAVAYACQLGASRIVDIATLTGACVVALGNVCTGLITNNTDLCNELLQAAKQTGEKMWELPNFPEYKEQIKSDIADLKNSGGRMAGTITAGLFIGEFVNDIPWVHMDIAGTSDSDKEIGYTVKGGTGIGVRTLLQFVQDMSKR